MFEWVLEYLKHFDYNEKNRLEKNSTRVRTRYSGKDCIENQKILHNTAFELQSVVMLKVIYDLTYDRLTVDCHDFSRVWEWQETNHKARSQLEVICNLKVYFYTHYFTRASQW